MFSKLLVLFVRCCHPVVGDVSMVEKTRDNTVKIHISYLSSPSLDLLVGLHRTLFIWPFWFQFRHEGFKRLKNTDKASGFKVQLL